MPTVKVDDAEEVPERTCHMTSWTVMMLGSSDKEPWEGLKCSVCGAVTRGVYLEFGPKVHPKYCPNCGGRVV